MTITSWRKSSHSAYNGNCAEVGSWWKSGRSAANGNCLEAGSCCCGVGIRDTKLEHSPVLVFGASQWERFTAAVRTGTVGH